MKFMTLRLWVLTIVSSLLLSVPYMIPHTGLVALVALLPLLAAEHIATRNNFRFFWVNIYICFFIWNLLTTYWIYLATLPGAVAAVTLNSLQMAVIFLVFRWCKRHLKGDTGYLVLIFLWLAWEHFYCTWQISWPWLALGNSFATSVKSIQWYSLTGTTGGSLWVLAVNVLLFIVCRRLSERQSAGWQSVALAALVIVPLLCSHIRFYTYREEGDRREVVVLQPNIDPYNDKFGNMTRNEQDEILLTLAKKGMSDSTFMVVAPETFFNPDATTGRIYENTPESNASFLRYSRFARENDVNFILGAVTHFLYQRYFAPGMPPAPAPTPTAHPFGVGQWIEAYNTALQFDRHGEVRYYHKSKLVILAESTPVINGKSLFKSLGIDLGGQIGSFGTQPYRTVFRSDDGVVCGTAICYESVFGDFYREYIGKGAQFMTIITNDGWWGNTAGHRQHLSYASLRAIETRRSIARSANTGISAFINQKGEIVSRTGWWEKDFLRGEVALNEKITPFVRYGDLLGAVSLWPALALVLLAVCNALLRRRRTTRIKG